MIPHSLCPALLCSTLPSYLLLLSLFFLLCSFHSPFHLASFDPSISLYKSIHISTPRRANTMDSCGDDKWKLSKKGRSRSGRSSSSYYSDGAAAASSSSSSAVKLSRSYSASVSATRDAVVNTTSTTGSSSSQQPGQPSSSRLSKKCVEAVKEQRARFYIVRRCVSMLVCWRDY